MTVEQFSLRPAAPELPPVSPEPQPFQAGAATQPELTAQPERPVVPSHETARVIGGVLVISPDWRPAARIGDVSPHDTVGQPLTSAERSLRRVQSGRDSILMNRQAVAEAAERAAIESANAAALHRLHMGYDQSLAEAQRALMALREPSDDHGILPVAHEALGVFTNGSTAEQNVKDAEPVTAVPAPITIQPAPGAESVEPVTAVPATGLPAADETAILTFPDGQQPSWRDHDRTTMLPQITPRQAAAPAETAEAAFAVPAAEAATPPVTAQTPDETRAAYLPHRTVAQPEAAARPDNGMAHDHAEPQSIDAALRELKQDVQFYSGIVGSITPDDPKYEDFSLRLREAETELAEAERILAVEGGQIELRRKEGKPFDPTDPMGHKERWDNEEGVDTLQRLLAGIRSL